MKNFVKIVGGFIIGIIYMGVPAFLGYAASRLVTNVYYRLTHGTSDKIWNRYFQR